MRQRIAVLLSGLSMLTTAVEAQPTREVTYNPRSVVRIDARLRMTTLVVLPEGEQILDFVCGDKDYWTVSGADNLAYIKPAKSKAVTNLNLVTATGHIYSFLLAEGAADPDLKVFVAPDPSARPATRAAATPNITVDVESLRREAAAAREDAISSLKATLPLRLHFPYVFEARTRPFNVTAIYHDDRFTYIRTEGQELPALYEVVDHVPNLVSFQVEQGVYVVPKILERGYLAIGKKRLSFDTGAR